jgi:anthranilate phosphoribosyltransferase
MVLLNAAAGLIAAGKTADPPSAVAQAAGAIDSGPARTLLAHLAQRSYEHA